MENLHTLRSVALVVDALGGDKAVTALTGVGRTSVANWCAAKRFPAKYYLLMVRELACRGFDAPPELWGQQQGKSLENAA